MQTVMPNGDSQSLVHSQYLPEGQMRTMVDNYDVHDPASSISTGLGRSVNAIVISSDRPGTIPDDISEAVELSSGSEPDKSPDEDIPQVTAISPLNVSGRPALLESDKSSLRQATYEKELTSRSEDSADLMARLEPRTYD